jgi:predicted phage-related endonuclease
MLNHAIRAKGIGASEVGAVVGADGAYDSALSVWARKVGIEQPANDVVPEFIRLGNLLEPVIAQLYCERTGFELRESDTIVHPSDPVRCCTPDRLVVGHPVNVQIKKIRTLASWGEPGTDEVPDNILLQTQWEMGILEAIGHHVERTDIPVLFYGSKFEVFSVTRDDELIGMLADTVGQWWTDYVVARRQPPIDGSERTKEALARIFKRNSGAMLEPTNEAIALAQEYMLARDEEKAASERKETAGNQLRALIGEADGFEWMGGKATWTRDSKGKPAWKAIAEALNAPAELIAKHMGEPGRVLRVTERRDRAEKTVRAMRRAVKEMANL